MKKIMTMMAMLTVGLSMIAQPQLKYDEKEVFKNDEVVIRQIDANTWEGNGNLMAFESIYLIEGNDKALLLDAGTDIKNLDKIVAGITKKPVTLMATHVHPDHTGASINAFAEIYINPADTVGIPEFMPNYKGKINYVKDGQVIDLGGRKLTVMFTPGHTPGSMTFFDNDKKYGFSGDAFGSGNLLMFHKVKDHLATCKKVAEYMEKHGIEYLYPGHYAGTNKETPQRIKDLIYIDTQLLNGNLKGETQAQPTLDLDKLVIERGMRVWYNDSKLK